MSTASNGLPEEVITCLQNARFVSALLTRAPIFAQMHAVALPNPCLTLGQPFANPACRLRTHPHMLSTPWPALYLTARNSSIWQHAQTMFPTSP